MLPGMHIPCQLAVNSVTSSIRSFLLSPSPSSSSALREWAKNGSCIHWLPILRIRTVIFTLALIGNAIKECKFSLCLFLLFFFYKVLTSKLFPKLTVRTLRLRIRSLSLSLKVWMACKINIRLVLLLLQFITAINPLWATSLTFIVYTN